MFTSFCWSHGPLLSRSFELNDHVSVIKEHLIGCAHCGIKESDSRIYVVWIHRRQDSFLIQPKAAWMLLAPNAADYPSWFSSAITLLKERICNE